MIKLKFKFKHILIILLIIFLIISIYKNYLKIENFEQCLESSDTSNNRRSNNMLESTDNNRIKVLLELSYNDNCAETRQFLYGCCEDIGSLPYKEYSVENNKFITKNDNSQQNNNLPYIIKSGVIKINFYKTSLWMIIKVKYNIIRMEMKKKCVN